MHTEYLHKLIETRRAEQLKEYDTDGAVIYLMNRDQRTTDNHALSFAQSLALEQNKDFYVVFILDTASGKYNARQIPFMLQGLQEIAQNLDHYNIPFLLLEGDTKKKIIFVY